LAEISADRSTALRGFALYHLAELMDSPGTSEPGSAVENDERRAAALDLLETGEGRVAHV
jgi:hypothetical protein